MEAGNLPFVCRWLLARAKACNLRCPRAREIRGRDSSGHGTLTTGSKGIQAPRGHAENHARQGMAFAWAWHGTSVEPAWVYLWPCLAHRYVVSIYGAGQTSNLTKHSGIAGGCTTGDGARYRASMYPQVARFLGSALLFIMEASQYMPL